MKPKESHRSWLRWGLGGGALVVLFFVLALVGARAASAETTASNSAESLQKATNQLPSSHEALRDFTASTVDELANVDATKATAEKYVRAASEPSSNQRMVAGGPSEVAVGPLDTSQLSQLSELSGPLTGQRMAQPLPAPGIGNSPVGDLIQAMPRIDVPLPAEKSPVHTASSAPASVQGSDVKELLDVTGQTATLPATGTAQGLTSPAKAVEGSLMGVTTPTETIADRAGQVQLASDPTSATAGQHQWSDAQDIPDQVQATETAWPDDGGVHLNVPMHGHEINVFNFGMQPKLPQDIDEPSAGLFGDWSAPMYLTAASIDSGRGSQRGTLTQTESPQPWDSFRFFGSGYAPINANALSIASGNLSQNGHTTQHTGPGQGFAGQLDMPVNANVLTWFAGNRIQNGNVDQSSSKTGDGSSFRIFDNVNMPLNGHFTSIDTGNASQNGHVTQQLDDTSSGSVSQFAGNLNMPVNGSHIAFDHGNASQNGDVTQIDRLDTSGSHLSIVDNARLMGAGSWTAFDVANAAQNGDVSQFNYNPPGEVTDEGVAGLGSSAQVFRNLVFAVNGAGEAGDVGNASQNGNRTQVDTAGNPGSMVTFADNADLRGVGAGQAGVVGNGAQNGPTDQFNTEPLASTDSDGATGWGSSVQVFRNLDLRGNGCGQCGVLGNGSQNSSVSQTDMGGNPGSLVNLSDNANIQGVGAGQSGVIGNGSQNDRVSQFNEHPVGGLTSEPTSAFGWGSGILGFRNANVDGIGAGQTGDLGNGSQNSNVTQTDTAGNPGSFIAVADNGMVSGIGAGQSGVIGNGSQNNHKVVQVNDQPFGETDGDGAAGWGSAVQLFRNGALQGIGAGQSGVLGNGSQNDCISQVDTMGNPGSFAGLADNGLVQGVGAGQAGGIGNGSQNTCVSQFNTGEPGSTLDAISGGVAAQSHSAQTGATGDANTSGWGSGIQLFRNATLQGIGAGQAGDLGNGSQNEHITQVDMQDNPGELINGADNGIVRGIGAGQSGVIGNGSQNGGALQINEGEAGEAFASGTERGFGGFAQLFRNGSVHGIGAGQAGGIGVGSQNGYVTQINRAWSPGAAIALADNGEVKGVGAGQAGVIGNGSQNGNPTQINVTEPSENLPSGNVSGFGGFAQVFRNGIVQGVGAGQAGGIGNGSQNGNPAQVNTVGDTGAMLGFADNANVQGIGGGQAGVIGNGSQNGNPVQVNDTPVGLTTPEGDSSGWGSWLQFGRNANVEAIGGGWAGLIGNGSQNGNPTQYNAVDNLGSAVGIADNLNFPVNGAGIAGDTGNGAQNGNPTLINVGESTEGQLFRFADVANFPVDGSGFALFTGNGIQNENPVLINDGTGDNPSSFLGFFGIEEGNLPWTLDGVPVSQGIADEDLDLGPAAGPTAVTVPGVGTLNDHGQLQPVPEGSAADNVTMFVPGVGTASDGMFVPVSGLPESLVAIASETRNGSLGFGPGSQPDLVGGVTGQLGKASTGSGNAGSPSNSQSGQTDTEVRIASASAPVQEPPGPGVSPGCGCEGLLVAGTPTVNDEDAGTTPGPSVDAGSPIAAAVPVTNGGGDTITDLSGSSPVGSLGCESTALLPGQTTTCVVPGTSTEGLQSVPVTLRAAGVDGSPLEAASTAYYTGLAAAGAPPEAPALPEVPPVAPPSAPTALLGVESPTVEGLAAGSSPGPSVPTDGPITLSAPVTNTGDVPWSELVGTSPLGDLSCDATALGVGESTLCSVDSTALSGAQAVPFSFSAVDPNGGVLSGDTTAYYTGVATGTPAPPTGGPAAPEAGGPAAPEAGGPAAAPEAGAPVAGAPAAKVPSAVAAGTGRSSDSASGPPLVWLVFTLTLAGLALIGYGLRRVPRRG